MSSNISHNKKPLGLWMTTSIVLGNMIGSGIFLLPAILAPYGGISLIGWLVTTCGAIAFALVFSQLSQKYPNTGGLYIYCREEFGEAIGFLLAWGYWLSLCAATAAISIAFTSYLSFFIPALAQNPIYAAIATLTILWSLTLLNTYSILGGGIMQLVTTILKIAPILLIACFGLFKLDYNNFIPFNPTNDSNISVIFHTATLTLWAFLGLECASIPADSISNPKRTIPLATIIGTVIASIVYISSTIAIMGLVKPNILQFSRAPFTEAASILWGNSGSIIIGITAIIACMGAINGWILIQGQIAFAIANDQLLPKIFTKKSRHDAPYVAIIVSSLISSVVILANYNDSLISMFGFAFELSTIQTLITFLFCAIARILLLNKTSTKKHKHKYAIIFIALFAFIYGLLVVASADALIVYWCTLVLLLGLPVYAWVKHTKANKS